MNKLMIFCGFIFLGGNLVCVIFAGTWLGGTDLSNIQNLTSVNVQTTQGVGGSSVITAATQLLTTGIPTMVTWGYPFLDDGIGAIFKWFFLYPITIGMIWGVVELFAPALTGIFSSIVGALKGLF